MFANNNNFDKDFYSVFGVKNDCSLDEVKSTYRTLAKKYHPDINPNNPEAEGKFKQLVEAYEVLSDKNKRSDYDFYKRQKQATQQHTPTSGFQHTYSSYSDFEQMKRKAEESDKKFWDDLKKAQQKENEFRYEKYRKVDEEYAQMHKDYYETHKVYEETHKSFSHKNTTEPRKVKVKIGSDIQIKVDLNEREFRHGVDKQIIIEKYVKCAMCEGTGSLLKREHWTVCGRCFGVGTNCKQCNEEGVTLDKRCNVCGGEGRMNKKVMERIVIPKNPRTGQRYKYVNKGDYGVRNERSGSLIIEIGGHSHTNFDIYKNDIMLYKVIDLDTAVFGGIIEVNNHEKKFKVNVNPGIKEGDIYKISKMGILNESGNKGDYYIKFKIIRN